MIDRDPQNIIVKRYICLYTIYEMFVQVANSNYGDTVFRTAENGQPVDLSSCESFFKIIFPKTLRSIELIYPKSKKHILFDDLLINKRQVDENNIEDRNFRDAKKKTAKGTLPDDIYRQIDNYLRTNGKEVYNLIFERISNLLINSFNTNALPFANEWLTSIIEFIDYYGYDYCPDSADLISIPLYNECNGKDHRLYGRNFDAYSFITKEHSNLSDACNAITILITTAIFPIDCCAERNIGINLNELFKQAIPSEDYDDSVFVDEYPPDGVHCLVGQEFKKRWTIKNAGTYIWHDRYMRCDPLPAQITVDNEIIKMPVVRPGEQYTLEVSYKAKDEGRYFSTWRIYDAAGNKAFPQKSGVYVTLVVDNDKPTPGASQVAISGNSCRANICVVDNADLIGCCSDISLKNCLDCTLNEDGSITIDYDFSSVPSDRWPAFISAVFRFYDDLDLLNLLRTNSNLKLHFDIESGHDIYKEIQVEFQTVLNMVVGSPFVVKASAGKTTIDIPISSYSKYVRDMKKIQNICFVINKESFMAAKGTVTISNITIM